VNRYGITVDTSKSELDQIVQLRQEHLRQYPSIIMKNPDFKHLREFVLSHEANQSAKMQAAPPKIQVMNVVKDLPGFEYCETHLKNYDILWNSTDKTPIEFIRWITAEYPKTFGESIRRCKNILNFIRAETTWIGNSFRKNEAEATFKVHAVDLIDLKTRIFCILHDIHEFPKCKTCGKTIIDNVLSIYEGFRIHCCVKCASSDPDVLSKISETCIENFGARSYLGSESGKKAKHDWVKNTYGVDHYSQTDEWYDKTSQNSMSKYGTKWHTQDQGIKDRVSVINKELSKEYTVRAGKTQRANRNGKFWTDEERKRISDENKKPENQKIREVTGIKRRIQTYEQKLCKNAWVEPLFSLDEFLAIHNRKLSTTEFQWKCKKCGNVFSRPMVLFYTDGIEDEQHKAYSRCPKCFPCLKTASMEELEVRDFIRSIISDEIEVVHGDFENFRVIPPYQLDMLLRRKKDGKIVSAIEFDGIYWHSIELCKDIQKQFRKTEMCEKIGLPLMHIFEDDWVNKRTDIEKLTRSFLDGDPIARTQDGILVLDRSVFNKAFIIPGYNLIDETPIEVIERRCVGKFGNESYHVPNCGNLIYKKHKEQMI